MSREETSFKLEGGILNLVKGSKTLGSINPSELEVDYKFIVQAFKKITNKYNFTTKNF